MLANLLILFVTFAIMSIIIFINHEINSGTNHLKPKWRAQSRSHSNTPEETKKTDNIRTPSVSQNIITTIDQNVKPVEQVKIPQIVVLAAPTKLPIFSFTNNSYIRTQNGTKALSQVEKSAAILRKKPRESDDEIDFKPNETVKKGTLVCNGKPVDSEIIYWKKVKGDRHFESPITPHHKDHHDKYLSFEYDNGGWNNVRMSLECILVVAHAMGRTLVIPPQQHLYLLGHTHADAHDKKAHDEMGFEDFFDLDLLQSHLGFHMITMKEFLTREASVGGLNPQRMRLPRNDTDLWGADLWFYLNKVADAAPSWMRKYMVFPAHEGDYNLTRALADPQVKKRMIEFGGDDGRVPIFYDEQLQQAHHIHIRGDGEFRVLQHHYAFAFFADPKVQSFYKRFVRDYVRYKDNIQCSGHELVQAVREDAKRLNPIGNGDFYALHIRRGDLQFKEVKISAKEIVTNLNFTDESGQYLIPPGSVVYLSTDDPDGVCKGCLVQRKPCEEYPVPKPVGCPEDPSWNAMIQYGWKLRFLRDYQAKGLLKDVNPNTLGMIETIVCSRAKVFAGTYFSTFTGYIHRLRGFHGLGEHTYYHHKHYVHFLKNKKSVGHGWAREFRAGWTDDKGNII